MKNKKIWGGIVGLVVLFIVEYLNTILSYGLECEFPDDHLCGIWLPIWMYNSLNPLWLFFLIIFFWGIIEFAIKEYKSKPSLNHLPMKNKKIWAGVAGLIVFFAVKHLILITMVYVENYSVELPNRLFNSLIFIFLFIFIWGIIELVVRKYKART